MNMEEFIRHHVEEGVNKFLLINDGSTDNGAAVAEQVANDLNVDLTIIPASISACRRILYTIHTRITKFFSLLRLRISTFPASVRQIKQTIYTNALPLVTTDWLMRVDMDEFWYAERGNIREYLAGLPEEMTSVQVVWQMFCSNDAFLKLPTH